MFLYEDLVSIADLYIKEVMEERGGDRQAFADLLSGKTRILEAFDGAGHNYYAILDSVYQYYLDHPDSHIDEILYESLETFLRSIKSPSDVYDMSMYVHYLVAHQEHVNRRKAPFVMDLLSLWKKYTHAVLDNEGLAEAPLMRYEFERAVQYEKGMGIDLDQLYHADDWVSWKARSKNINDKADILIEGKRIQNVLIVLALFVVTAFIPYVAPFLLIALFLLLASSIATSITVTTTRVYGRTSFGEQVDLPLGSISSVDMGAFHGINIRTSSEKFSFMGIDNREEIQQTLRSLLEDLKKDPAADAANEQ